MRRYNVPRVVFVNKLDRVGANPFRVIQQAREKLKLNAAAVQVGQGWHMWPGATLVCSRLNSLHLCLGAAWRGRLTLFQFSGETLILWTHPQQE
jgi:hypothetical protein